jgi:hypothetical protein
MQNDTSTSLTHANNMPVLRGVSPMRTQANALREYQVPGVRQLAAFKHLLSANTLLAKWSTLYAYEIRQPVFVNEDFTR